MKVLVIPDVHLKPEMFDRAEQILATGQADYAIQLGDLVDDWGKLDDNEAYEDTLERALRFAEQHPDTKWLYGNHDFLYTVLDKKGMLESGHSPAQANTVREFYWNLKMADNPATLVYEADGCLFTHAGITMAWLKRHLPKSGWTDEVRFVKELIDNADPVDLWEEDSPIWARPQHTGEEMYLCKLQIVGHTPVAEPSENDAVLSTDVFSTSSKGRIIGNQQFVIVDTESGTFAPAKEEQC